MVGVHLPLTLLVPNTAKLEITNSVIPDEMAHYEVSYLDLKCLHSSLQIFNIIQFELNFFFKLQT